MTISYKIATALQFAKAKLLKRKIPLIVSWAITYRCNQACLYCQWPKVNSLEVSTKEACLIIDKLGFLGTKRINFTGGEPLLRKDISELVDYIKNRKMFVCINSNGVLIPTKITRLKRLDLLNLSLEGPVEIHDCIRGAGGYAAVMAAAESARLAGVNVKLTATINNLNACVLEYIIKIAWKLNLEVTFQVVDDYKLGCLSENPLKLKSGELQKALSLIIAYKKQSKYKAVIGNSLALLEYLLQWPNLVPLKCASGNIVFRITPDAKLFTCAAATFKELAVSNNWIDLKDNNVKEIKAVLKGFDFLNIKCVCSCSNRLAVSLLWDMSLRLKKKF
ncbi:MAG: radical SAM protein [Candidatus Omnitrophica bacterium]|nr:radical SAM protein [Candidatus Omnitrophota bacterium]